MVCQASTEIGVVDCAVVSLSAPLTFVWDGRPLLLVAGITSSRLLEDLVESFMCETRDLDVSVTFGLVVLGLLGALDRLHFEVRSVEVLSPRETCLSPGFLVRFGPRVIFFSLVGPVVGSSGVSFWLDPLLDPVGLVFPSLPLLSCL